MEPSDRSQGCADSFSVETNVVSADSTSEEYTAKRRTSDDSNISHVDSKRVRIFDKEAPSLEQYSIEREDTLKALHEELVSLRTQPSVEQKTPEKDKFSPFKVPLPVSQNKPSTSTSDGNEISASAFDNEIDRLLEEKAYRNNLTVINVKNILKHIITNEHVLAMVRNSMQDEQSDGDDPSCYEPKLTRSRVKKILESMPDVSAVSWPVSPALVSPLKYGRDLYSNAVSVESVAEPVLELIQKEFGEDEEGDPDYQPETDSVLEQEVDSDDDDSTTSHSVSDINSPACLSAAATPLQPDLDSSAEDEVKLLIISEDESIAQRTRSRLPLTDTPLEQIEDEFIAPDITTDMYDWECDDVEWNSFLRDIVRPTNTLDETHADISGTDDDPEYCATDDEDQTDHDEDLRHDKAVRVTKKELHELMLSLDRKAIEMCRIEEEEEKEKEKAKLQEGMETDEGVGGGSSSDEAEVRVSDLWEGDDIAVLQEQMRMHVQLLSQTLIVCSMNERTTVYAMAAKKLLTELSYLASQITLNLKVTHSQLNPANLAPAIELCRNYVDQDKHFKSMALMLGKSGLSVSAGRVLVQTNVFVYPDLLPRCGVSTKKNKVKFSESEENLLALGLEQFQMHGRERYGYISKFMLPVYDGNSLAMKAKNMRCSRAPDSYVKDFFAHKNFDIPRLRPPPRPFDVKVDFVAPLERDYTDLDARVKLPDWFITMIHRKVKDPVKDPTAVPMMSKKQMAIRPKECLNRSSVMRRSPMKAVSPILRKYVKARHNIAIKPKPVLRTKLVLRPKPTAKVVTATADTSTPDLPLQDDAPPPVVPFQSRPGPSGRVSNQRSQSDNEPEDNQNDLAALMAASTTIVDQERRVRHRARGSVERRLKPALSRSLIQLLQPDVVENDPLKVEKEEILSMAYLVRAREHLRNEEKFNQFVAVFQSFGNTTDIVSLYSDICALFEDSPEMRDDFAAFLTPDQAFECGVFQKYLEFHKMKVFLRKVEIYFGRQSHHHLRFVRTLNQCGDCDDEKMKDAIIPLLAKQPHLVEDFLGLFPNERPPDYMLREDDFEEIFQEDIDGHHSPDGSTADSETIKLPYIPIGGRDCSCVCHHSTKVKFNLRRKHCLSCSIVYKNGEIFIQSGNRYLPAKISNTPLPGSAALQHEDDANPPCLHIVQETETAGEMAAQNGDDALETGLPRESRPPLPNEVTTKDCRLQEAQELSDDNVSVISDSDLVSDDSLPAEPADWTKSEDKLILETCRSLGSTDSAFEFCSRKLDRRTAENVRYRFNQLMAILASTVK